MYYYIKYTHNLLMTDFFSLVNDKVSRTMIVYQAVYHTQTRFMRMLG